MTRLRKECDDLKAAEIRALKAKKAGLEKPGLKKKPAQWGFFWVVFWVYLGFLDFYVLFVHKNQFQREKLKKKPKNPKTKKKHV